MGSLTRGGSTERVALTDWFEYEWADWVGEAPRRFPLLPITLRSNQRTLATYGLVDSGSERSYIPRAAAQKLRSLPARYDGNARPAGGSFAVGDATLTLEVALGSGSMRVAGCQFKVPEDPKFVPHVVLGREPLFLLAEVRFQDWRRRFGIARRPKPAFVMPPMWLAPTRETEPLPEGRRRASGVRPDVHSPRKMP